MDYIKEARRTEATTMHPVPYFEVVRRVENTVEVIKKLDELKKGVFYGKNLDKIRWDGPSSILEMNDGDRSLFHGILGVATEAGELLEALLHRMTTGEGYDRVNLQEEVGDCFWYLALIADTTGASFEEIMARNIAKLRKRFPEKFREELAIHRDTSEERRILEA